MEIEYTFKQTQIQYRLKLREFFSIKENYFALNQKQKDPHL